MLVLSRRLNEKIVLPSLGVTVQVLAVRGGAVRLGIQAPPDIAVLREELVGKPDPRAEERVAEPFAR
jgi:carbon storage regulator CsrA